MQIEGAELLMVCPMYKSLDLEIFASSESIGLSSSQIHLFVFLVVHHFCKILSQHHIQVTAGDLYRSFNFFESAFISLCKKSQVLLWSFSKESVMLASLPYSSSVYCFYLLFILFWSANIFLFWSVSIPNFDLNFSLTSWILQMLQPVFLFFLPFICNHLCNRFPCLQMLLGEKLHLGFWLYFCHLFFLLRSQTF